jgi:hypothetical protein
MEGRIWDTNRLTTFRSYVSAPQTRQAEIVRKLPEPKPPEDEVWKQLKKTPRLAELTCIAAGGLVASMNSGR